MSGHQNALFIDEFRKYFDHLLTLSFEDTPDYTYLKSLFRDLFRKKRFEYDSVLYDWEVIATTGEKLLLLLLFTYEGYWLDSFFGFIDL
jgi:hypothetical protein